MPDSLQYFFTEYAAYLSTLAWVSVVFFLAGITITPLLLAAIPEDYFCQQSAPQKHLSGFSWLKTLLLRGLKNILGLSLIIAGLLMLVLPGQGILTLIIGMLLIDYPGKYQLEKKLVFYPPILKAINWARHKRNKNDLQTPK